MKPERLALKGKTVFITAMITVVLTIVTVYINGINYNRSLSSNLYISLGIIALALFVFLTYVLYKGARIIDNSPALPNYEPGLILEKSGWKLPAIDGGDDIGEILFGILMWVLMAISIVLLLLLFEAIFWLSLLIIFATLYWVFIRALKIAIYKSRRTQGDFTAALFNALWFTGLYTGWLFAVAGCVDLLR